MGPWGSGPVYGQGRVGKVYQERTKPGLNDESTKVDTFYLYKSYSEIQVNPFQG